MFELIYSEKFVGQLKKLPSEVQKRIINSLERTRIRPQAYMKKLVGNPLWRLRVGDYRVIVEIKMGKLLIFVIEVKHRRNIYK
ncbi:MAG: cytotoxic translational repressor of toxin-antitoxin stability system [Nanoarchaeota archaeon]|nr:cytotoxic translational repressor of toxin-antitoxin stability system [Nanoarchaeota archaeon]|tara:strand:- start:881 stop:1129 length:249 start_codon:yes stop_codon:yes gene_type:complete